MPTELAKNIAYSTLASDITIGATSLTVATGTGTRFPAASTGVSQFHAILTAPGANLLAGAAYEIVICTNRATDICTITRHAESTTAQAWPAGTVIAATGTVESLANTFDALGAAAAAAAASLPLAGGTMAGNVAMGGHDVTGAGTVAATTLTGDGSGITGLPTPPTPTLEDVTTAGATTDQAMTINCAVPNALHLISPGGHGTDFVFIAEGTADSVYCKLLTDFSLGGAAFLFENSAVGQTWYFGLGAYNGGSNFEIANGTGSIQFSIDSSTGTFNFNGNTLNLGGGAIVLGGGEIGNSASDTFGFWGAAAIAQRASADQAAVPTDTPTLAAYGFTLAQATAILTLLNELRAGNVAAGLIKGSA